MASRTSRRPSFSMRRASFPEHAYTFKHVLTQQVAYETAAPGAAAHAARPHRRGPGDALSRTGWPSRWNAWPIMPCGARSGTRP